MKKIVHKRKAKKWTNDEIEFLKENYKHMSYRQISDKTGFSYAAISHKAHKLGLDSRSLWTEKENQIIIDNYWCNPDVWSLLPNRSREAIKVQARKLGIKRQCGNYSINHRFFESWSKECAYIIGFLLADGCVEPHFNRISIELSSVDYSQLEMIRSLIGSNNPICHKKTRKSCSLYIHNRKMVNDVIQKGVIPNKTARVRLPDVPKKYLNHLLRGYMDGDGSIYLDGSLRIQFLGNEKMIWDIKKTLSCEYGIESSTPRIHNKGSDKCWDIKISGKKALKLSNILYDQSDGILMKRKYEKTKVPARGEIPGITNPAQISQFGTSSIKEPERKTGKQISVQRLHAGPQYG